jgi:D-alanyl-lipoteichoic acid acyltransferase DltB (MBOAT superfamily)
MSWNPQLIVLILTTTAVSYTSGVLLEKYEAKSLRKLFLWVNISVSLGLLFFFKYFNFLSETVVYALRQISIPANDVTLKVILPVGISFYTFQTLSYVIDVYKGNMKAERHFGIYALYVSFFPQLVAGPIERPQNLLPQFYQEHYFDYDKGAYGLKLIAWGLFKKIIIADTLSKYVNLVYNDISQHQGLAFIIATFFFAIQIYCDFSGYSDIAIGSAKLMGFDLMKNFNSPYFSKSIKEFWSRWHISLSTWFRDYVYIPLGGNRVKRGRHLLNLWITFLASGLWHGANWTFVLWGGIHGAFIVIEQILSNLKKELRHSRIRDLFSMILTITIVVFAWVFFRANTISDAFVGLKTMFIGIDEPIKYFKTAYMVFDYPKLDFIKIIFVTSLLLVFDYFNMKRDVINSMKNWNVVIRWSVYLIFLFLFVFLDPRESSEFIYFQF